MKFLFYVIIFYRYFHSDLCTARLGGGFFLVSKSVFSGLERLGSSLSPQIVDFLKGTLYLSLKGRCIMGYYLLK